MYGGIQLMTIFIFYIYISVNHGVKTFFPKIQNDLGILFKYMHK